jgi:DNA-binding transcriptional ArsR family regulator
MAPKLERHADQLGALGHPIRLQILRVVVQAGSQGVAAGKIQSSLDIPASTLSFHLKRLTHAGLLTSRSEGTFLYYTTDYAVLRELTDYLWEDCCKGGSSPKGCR